MICELGLSGTGLRCVYRQCYFNLCKAESEVVLLKVHFLVTREWSQHTIKSGPNSWFTGSITPYRWFHLEPMCMWTTNTVLTVVSLHVSYLATRHLTNQIMPQKFRGGSPILGRLPSPLLFIRESGMRLFDDQQLQRSVHSYHDRYMSGLSFIFTDIWFIRLAWTRAAALNDTAFHISSTSASSALKTAGIQCLCSPAEHTS